MKESTSTNLGLKNKNVTEEKIKNFKLSKTLINLLMHEPFYSRIIRSLNKIETEQIPTAGVLHKDGEINLWWNRYFFASLTEEECRGVLKHECLHLIYKHTSDRKRDPHIIWNYSTDLAINSLIPERELPKGGLIPGKSLPILSNEDIENMSDESISNYNNLSDLIKKLPPNKTSEYYFNELMKSEDIKKLLESEEKNGGLYDMGFDNHEGWGNISKEEKELIEGKISEILKDAVKEGNSSGWGSVPSSIQKQLNKMFSRSISWKDILKRFCSFTRSNERLSSRKKLNRKYPNVHPGIKKDYRPTIAVYIDESGSVSDSDLAPFYSELDSLSKLIDFYMYKFDFGVNEDTKVFWKKGKRIKLERNLTGGTCFKAVTKHALKNKKNIDGYIIFTDGLAPKPQSSRGLKRCWIITPNSNLMFKPDSCDVVVNIKTNC